MADLRTRLAATRWPDAETVDTASNRVVGRATDLPADAREPGDPEERPNILVVMTDDQRAARTRQSAAMRPLAAYFKNLKARLDAYSERQLDEMDKYQTRKAI